jgi:hypothetical protein
MWLKAHLISYTLTVPSREDDTRLLEEQKDKLVTEALWGSMMNLTDPVQATLLWVLSKAQHCCALNIQPREREVLSE